MQCPIQLRKKIYTLALENLSLLTLNNGPFNIEYLRLIYIYFIHIPQKLFVTK